MAYINRLSDINNKLDISNENQTETNDKLSNIDNNISTINSNINELKVNIISDLNTTIVNKTTNPVYTNITNSLLNVQVSDGTNNAKIKTLDTNALAATDKGITTASVVYALNNAVAGQIKQCTSTNSGSHVSQDINMVNSIKGTDESGNQTNIITTTNGELKNIITDGTNDLGLLTLDDTIDNTTKNIPVISTISGLDPNYINRKVSVIFDGSGSGVTAMQTCIFNNNNKLVMGQYTQGLPVYQISPSQYNFVFSGTTNSTTATNVLLGYNSTVNMTRQTFGNISRHYWVFATSSPEEVCNFYYSFINTNGQFSNSSLITIGTTAANSWVYLGEHYAILNINPIRGTASPIKIAYNSLSSTAPTSDAQTIGAYLNNQYYMGIMQVPNDYFGRIRRMYFYISSTTVPCIFTIMKFNYYNSETYRQVIFSATIGPTTGNVVDLNLIIESGAAVAVFKQSASADAYFYSTFELIRQN